MTVVYGVTDMTYMEDVFAGRGRASDATAASLVGASLRQTLLRRRWWVVFGLIVGCLGAAEYLAFTPRTYQAQVELLIDGRLNPVSARDTAASAAPLEIPEFESQIELLQSSRIVGRAVGALPEALRQDLARQYRPSRSSPLAIAKRLLSSFDPARGESKQEPASGQQRAVDAVREGISMRRVGASYAIEISFSSVDPVVAAAVANAVAAAYVRDQIESKSDLWRRAGGWMEQRLADLGDQAAASAKQAQEFKAEHAIIDMGNRGLVVEQQLQESSSSLLDAKAKVGEAKARLDQAQKALAQGDELLLNNLEDPLLEKMRGQVSDLRRKVVALTAMLGPSHEAVRLTQGELASAQAGMQSELRHLLQALQSAYDVAVARQASLEASFQTLVGQSGKTNQARVASRELDRKAEAYNTVYTGLLQRYADAVNQQSFPIPTAQIISEAQVPTSPSAPRGKIVVAVGLLLGLGAGIAMACLRDVLDRAVTHGDEIERLGIPCYGMLPMIDRESEFADLRLRMSSQISSPADVTLQHLKAGYLRYETASRFGHSVNMVKTRIVLSRHHVESHVLGITSIQSGEGKSTVASNLSHLFGRSERRTLLIDADIFNPTLSRLFGLAECAGLTEILSGTEDFDGVKSDVGGTNLTVLGAGVSSHHGLDHVLGSSAMRRFIAAMRERYEQIIIDLPPSTEIASTREIAPALDSLILVATWRKTKMPTLARAVKEFNAGGARGLSVVLNKTSPRSLGPGHAYAAYAKRMRGRVEA